MDDFRAMQDALAAYHLDHGSFPVVAGGVTAMLENGELNEAWIPGLVPQYLSAVPVDPRRSLLPNLQYLYLSNGSDYKLVAHGAEDAPAVARERPGLSDPRRPGYAYGVWTEAARDW